VSRYIASFDTGYSKDREHLLSDERGSGIDRALQSIGFVLLNEQRRWDTVMRWRARSGMEWLADNEAEMSG